jgi:hypothetical protein
MSRGGFLDHGAFRFVILDGQGAVVAQLPLGEADSPHKGGNYLCVPHRRLDGFITRSENALHLFDRDTPDGPISDGAAVVLGRSGGLGNLTSLTMWSRSLSASGVAALLALKTLRELVIWYADLGAVDPLLSPVPSVRLELLHCKMGKTAEASLMTRWGPKLRVR